MALRHQRRLLQRSEINLGREGTAQAANFPELRNEIVALKKLEQEQKELTLRIAQLEEGIKRIEAERQQNTADQNAAIAKLEAEKKPLLQQRNQAKTTADVCERELAAVERRIREYETTDRTLLKQLVDLPALEPPPSDFEARARHHKVEERKTPAYLNIGRHLSAQGIAPPNAPHLLTDAHRHRGTVDQLLQHRAELTTLSNQIDMQELRKFYFSVVSILAL